MSPTSSAGAGEAPATEGPAAGRTGRTVWFTATVAAASAAVIGALAWPASRLDFYYDEMWRAEQVRSADPVATYLAFDTPIPPGWVMTLWTVFRAFPDRRPLLRAAAVAFGIVAACLLAFALVRILRRSRAVPPSPPAPRAAVPAIAAIAAVATFAAPALAAHAVYFNNYLADVAVGAALLWAVVQIDLDTEASHVAWTVVAALAVVAPWLAQGALFLVPGCAAIVWPHRAEAARRAAFSLVAVVASTAVVAAFFLRPVAANGTVDDFWVADTPAAGLGAFLRRFGTTFVDGAYPAWVVDRPAVLAVALGATAFGLVVLQRAWRWWLPLYLSAQVVALVAAVAVGWPATFARVNTAFQFLVLVAAPVGASIVVWHGAAWLAARAGRRAAAAAAVVAAAVIAVGWWPRQVVDNSTGTAVYARGLTGDLAIVASGADEGDLVGAYHLSAPYVRDRLLGRDDVAPGVVVVDEMNEPAGVYDLGSFVTAQTPSIWCVVPYEAGPESTAAACAAGPEWSETFRTLGRRALVLRLERTASVAGP